MHINASIRQRSVDKALLKDHEFDSCSINDKKTDLDSTGKSSKVPSNLNFEKNFITKLATTTAKASKLVYNQSIRNQSVKPVDSVWFPQIDSPQRKEADGF